MQGVDAIIATPRAYKTYHSNCLMSLGLKMCVPVWEGQKTLLQCFKHNFSVDTTSKKNTKW